MAHQNRYASFLEGSGKLMKNMSLRVRFLFVPGLALLGLCLTLCSTLFGACVCPPPVGCAQQPTGPCATPPGSTYILRYSNVGVHGQMTFIGNTLGLSKAVCVNDRGQSDAIGDIYNN